MFKLSDKTAQFLSSGQVISSASNAVKELVENSLDANATVVEVKLEKGGLSKIEVRDNGNGIKAENMDVAAQRHYTSKIELHSDLQKLVTYGFRGEALNSLCEVADVTITTRTKNEPYSNVYILDCNGRIKSKKPSHIAQGTTVTALNLFKNLPVRKQFFSSAKKIKEQLVLTENILIGFAISRPFTHFKLINDRCIIWQKSSENNEKNVFLHILGLSNSQLHNIESNCSINNVNIKVFFPIIYIKRKTKDRLFTIINRRPVHHKQIEKLFRSLILKVTNNGDTHSGGWPAALILIDVLPSNIDVNVNANKTEVFLTQNQVVLSLLETMFDSYLLRNCVESGLPDDNSFSINNCNLSNSVQDLVTPTTAKCVQEKQTSEQHDNHNILKERHLDKPTENCVDKTFSLLEADSISIQVKNLENTFGATNQSPSTSEKENCYSTNIVLSSSVDKHSVDSDSVNGLKSSNVIGSVNWSLGEAVINDNGGNAQPVRIARPLARTADRTSSMTLRQSTLDTVVSEPAFKRPRTVDEVSLDSTNEQWNDLGNDKQNEIIQKACFEYDAFTKDQSKLKKKNRKSFLTLSSNDNNNSDDENFIEPEKMFHVVDLSKLTKRINNLSLYTSQKKTNLPNVIGFVNEEKATVLRYFSDYFIVNLYRLQEALIFKKLSQTMKLPCADLEKTILISEGTIDHQLYSCLLSMAHSAATHLQPDVDVIDKRITYNGFKIRKIQSPMTEFHIYALANFVSSFGITDLLEVLGKYNQDKSITIEESRPAKCVFYLQSEASRMARSSPLLRSKVEILDSLLFLKKESQTWLDFFSDCCCYHSNNVFQRLQVKKHLT